MCTTIVIEFFEATERFNNYLPFFCFFNNLVVQDQASASVSKYHHLIWCDWTAVVRRLCVLRLYNCLSIYLLYLPTYSLPSIHLPSSYLPNYLLPLTVVYVYICSLEMENSPQKFLCRMFLAKIFPNIPFSFLVKTLFKVQCSAL